MCPAAEQLLGQLAEVYGPDRVVPIALHVDYFNEPWEDPYSHKMFSEREFQYSLLYTKANRIKDQGFLYFTPMLMVDGRIPMLGSDRLKAEGAIKQVLTSKPGVNLGLTLKDGRDDRHKTLEVALSRPSPTYAGKEVLVGLAIYEDPVTTKVKSGENGGKTLTGRYAARRLEVRVVRLDRSEPITVTFPAVIEAGWDTAKCGLAVYAQDETTGRILQAASVKWLGDRKETPRGRD
jgi:hypothetical protein